MTQTERMAAAYDLIDSVWSEVREGKAEDILQTVVNVQVDVNRLVWKLNEIMEVEDE